ncbi:BT_3928 family protein [Flammeovirga aprica]|uniref:DoxX family protein n=1 Tax=Flammeovirga aprica JL-4 TaxID=694437 RepID=A0A7X9P2T2_9BACT|nr:BT_3928 family protein [Flammeovirga aprica]NME68285.1 DoxX family protein [Flammeovirga aprica JL-4]
MKNLYRLLAIIVGLVFIASGLVKVDDPTGTAIKFEEYFHVFADDVSGTFGALEMFFLFLADWALPMSVLFSSYELVLGVALVVGYREKFSMRATLALLLFFGVLTFYSAWFNKVTDCGCFGDAIKFTPWGSFTKDIVLLVLLLGAMALKPKKAITQYGTYGGSYTVKKSAPIWKFIVVVIASVFAFGTCYYALNHLPPVDFRPYKVGANIQKMMSPEVPCESVYYMEKDGEEKMFTTYPTDPSWKFVRMEITNEEECKSLIPDYYISNTEGDDFTALTTNAQRLLVIVQNVSEIDKEEIATIKQMLTSLQGTVATMVVTSDASDFDKFMHESQWNVPYYYADATVLLAMVRANPGILLIDEGTILGKWHHNDTPSADEISQLLN